MIAHPPQDKQKTLFIVGCSRSGTTVLQNQLVHAATLFSMPETAFFRENLRNSYCRLSALDRLASCLNPDYGNTSRGGPAAPWRGLRASVYWLHRLGLRDFSSAVAFSPNVTATIFNREFTRAAASHKCKGWLEKTPLHCFNIDFIRQHARPDGFVFCLRDGLETAASLRQRAQKHPEAFGHQNDLRRAASLWNKTLQHAWRQLGKEDVFFVSFESFVNDVEDTLGKVTAHFGLPTANAQQRNATSFRLFEQDELWKSTASNNVTAPPPKACRMFTPMEKTELDNMLNFRLYKDIVKQLKANPAWGVA